MKKLSFICGLVLVLTACQQHSVSELKSIESQDQQHEAHSAQPEKEAK